MPTHVRYEGEATCRSAVGSPENRFMPHVVITPWTASCWQSSRARSGMSSHKVDVDNPSTPPPRLSFVEQGDAVQARRAALQGRALETSLSATDVDHSSTPPPRLSLFEQADVEEARRAALQDRALECSLDVGVAERVGKKGEDRVVVVPRFIGDDDDYFAVFDGHRGSGVATHAAATLHEELRSALLCGEPPPAACRLALARCHASAQQLKLHDGAAALALLSLGGGSEVWVFNAGDCRAVLCSPTDEVDGGGAARRLSVDHKASVPEEQARVEAAGGTVLFGCLEGMLELSRGLGDFDFCRGGFSQELELHTSSDHACWLAG